MQYLVVIVMKIGGTECTIGVNPTSLHVELIPTLERLIRSITYDDVLAIKNRYIDNHAVSSVRSFSILLNSYAHGTCLSYVSR